MSVLPFTLTHVRGEQCEAFSLVICADTSISCAYCQIKNLHINVLNLRVVSPVHHLTALRLKTLMLVLI